MVQLYLNMILFIFKKIKSRTTEKSRSGWLYMLKPSPELWTMSLPHRTQIIYNMDASYICLELELSQNKTICEAGIEFIY